MNNTKEFFVGRIKKLLDECNQNNIDSYGNVVNDIDRISVLSVIYQNICNYEYTEFIMNLKENNYDIEFKVGDGFYRIGEIVVSVAGAIYSIIIEVIPEMIGYCTCEQDDPDYDEEHQCTGIGCDWYVPNMIVLQNNKIGESKFKGMQRDLWKQESILIEHDKEYIYSRKAKRLKEISTQIKALEDSYTYLKQELDEIDFDS